MALLSQHLPWKKQPPLISPWFVFPRCVGPPVLEQGCFDVMVDWRSCDLEGFCLFVVIEKKKNQSSSFFWVEPSEQGDTVAASSWFLIGDFIKSWEVTGFQEFVASCSLFWRPGNWGCILCLRWLPQSGYWSILVGVSTFECRHGKGSSVPWSCLLSLVKQMCLIKARPWHR